MDPEPAGSTYSSILWITMGNGSQSVFYLGRWGYSFSIGVWDTEYHQQGFMLSGQLFPCPSSRENRFLMDHFFCLFLLGVLAGCSYSNLWRTRGSTEDNQETSCTLFVKSWRPIHTLSSFHQQSLSLLVCYGQLFSILRGMTEWTRASPSWNICYPLLYPWLFLLLCLNFCVNCIAVNKHAVIGKIVLGDILSVKEDTILYLVCRVEI